MTRSPTVVLVGTLDTKGLEYAYLRDRIREAGADVLLVDAGVLGEPLVAPDVTREEVARAGGADHAELVQAADRGRAVDVMGRGAAAVLTALHAEGRLDGTAAVGGSGNSSIAAQAMRALPVGVPKLIVSTVASGDTRRYVGAVDIAMMYSVVDIAGINQISARILTNAAGAIAGMAKATVPDRGAGKPLVGATMFGVTTPCVTTARERLEEHGYEVLVFHATGTGGQSFEALATGGFLAGVLDATTTELADDLVGGDLSAGPDRLEAVGAAGLPQVVSLGALDMVNFGPREEVPERFLELPEVLHAVGALPLRALPLILRDAAIAGQARPVGLGELALQGVVERLVLGRVGVRLAVAGTDVRGLRRGFVAHGCTSEGDRAAVWAAVRTDRVRQP